MSLTIRADSGKIHIARQSTGGPQLAQSLAEYTLRFEHGPNVTIYKDRSRRYAIKSEKLSVILGDTLKQDEHTFYAGDNGKSGPIYVETENPRTEVDVILLKEGEKVDDAKIGLL